MPASANNLAATTPRPGVPFLQAVSIKTEPRGDFARFFLRAEQLLFQSGITLRVATPDDLIVVNEANRESWPPLFAAMDNRKTPILARDMNVLIGYDHEGRAVTTAANMKFDYSQTTAYDELTSLRLLFADRAAEMRQTIEFELTAPTAKRITGQVLYAGAIWVHPDYRKHGVTRITPKLNRYFALSQKYFDFEFAMASAALLKPHVAASYSVQASEPYYAYIENGKKIYDGVFNWTSRDFALATLTQDVQQFENASSLVEVGRNQQPASQIA